MTHVITFDTLAYANRLKKAGVDQKLAEALVESQAELLSNLVDDQLATKQDIKDLDNSLQIKMQALEHRLLIKLGGLMGAGIGLLATMITILHMH